MIFYRFMFFVILQYMKKEDSMGDGKNLKKYLDEKGTNVRKIAKATKNFRSGQNRNLMNFIIYCQILVKK